METMVREEDEIASIDRVLTRLGRKGRMRTRAELNSRRRNNQKTESKKAFQKALPNPSIILFQKGWEKLKNEGIEIVLAYIFNEKEDISFQNLFPHSKQIELYSTVYSMCTQETPYNWSGRLYYQYSDELNEICQSRFLPPLLDTSDSDLLQALCKCWNDFNWAIKRFHRVFAYLDRFYVNRIKVLNLQSIGTQAFRDNVFHPLKERIASAFIQNVASDRKNKAFDPSLLEKVCNIFKQVGMGSTDIYEAELEKPFLQETTKYMKTTASSWIETCTCPQYIYRVRSQLMAESKRVDRYLLQVTKEKLLEVCRTQLISEPLLEFLEKTDSGCLWLLQNDKVDELKTIFQLCSKVKHALIPISKIFRNFLFSRGQELIRAPTLSEKKLDGNYNITLAIVEIHVKYRRMLKECFGNHTRFHRALKDAFEDFLNMQPQNGSTDVEQRVAMSEVLADYIDRRIRKQPQEMRLYSGHDSVENNPGIFLSPRTESLLENHLRQVVEIVKYLNDKDAFAEFHRKRLSKRLLLDRTSSFESESIIAKTFGDICGVRMASNIFGMLQDMKLQKDLNLAFHDYLTEANKIIGYEMSVKVLSSRYWPTYRNESFNLPKEMTEGIEYFKEFYNMRTANRQLRWVHGLGSMTISVTLNAKKMDLILNTVQASILILLGQKGATSLFELAEEMGVSEKKTLKHISSLSSAKFQLVKLDKNSEKYSFNYDFTHRHRTLRIPMFLGIKQKERTRERSENMKVVSELRKHTIEASIVRIMKSHKNLGFNTLLEKTTEALKSQFKPDISVLKKRIEDLIDRDYIERSETDPNEILYVS